LCGASWFETREVALLTMRVLRPHPEEHREAMRLEGWMQALNRKTRASYPSALSTPSVAVTGWALISTKAIWQASGP
jgi:hypothetical protein